MNFAEIKAAVRDLWEFVWPPIVLLIVLVLLARFVAPLRVERLRERLGGVIDREKIAALRTAAEQMGVATALPIATLFFLIFILYVTSTTVITFGSMLPPSIATSSEASLARSLGDADVACLWSRYSADGELLHLAELARAEGKVKTTSESLDYWIDRRDRFGAAFDALKFIALWALVWAFAEGLASRAWGRALIRVLPALVLTLFAVVASIAMYLFASQQIVHARAADLRTLLASAPCTPAVTLSNVQATELAALRRDELWSLESSSFSYARWFMDNINK
ncbi:MAG TPA: hypothetical protein VF618_26520 [Thermoanaerobaculia bacterium]